MLRLIKQVFIALLIFSGSLASTANASDFTTWTYSCWLKSSSRTELLSICGYWDRCNGSCSTLDDPSGKICVQNKTKDVNLSVFNIIRRKMNQKH